MEALGVASDRPAAKMAATAIKLSHAGSDTKRRVSLDPPLSLKSLRAQAAALFGPAEFVLRGADDGVLRTDAELASAAAAVAGSTLCVELLDPEAPPPLVSMIKQADGSWVLGNGQYLLLRPEGIMTP